MADEIKKEETVAAAPEATEEKEYLKPAYQGEYDDKLKDLYTQMAARQPFQYNANEDALYQQYVDRYQQQGKQAMRDTIGQGTALTGGYTNSYAQNVGQQAYDSYLQGLNDKLSETYGLAMQAYQMEGDRLANLFSQTGALADSDYQRLMADAEARKGMGDKSLLKLLTGMPVTSGGGGVSYGGEWYGSPNPNSGSTVREGSVWYDVDSSGNKTVNNDLTGAWQSNGNFYGNGWDEIGTWPDLK